MRDERKRNSLLKRLQEAVRRLLRKKEKPPEGDPYAYVTVPVRRGPKGRSGAAVADFEDDRFNSFPPRR